MAKSRDRVSSLRRISHDRKRPLLFELKGRRDAEDGIAATVSTEMIAALSIEEVVAFVRGRQPSVEIVELKVLGKVQVLSAQSI